MTILLAGAMLLPVAAAAPDTGLDRDVACLAVVAMAAGSDKVNNNQKNSLAMAVTYYMGRVDARRPGYDIEGALRRYYAGTSPTVMKADLSRCGSEFESVGHRMIDMGKSMQGTPAK